MMLSVVFISLKTEIQYNAKFGKFLNVDTRDDGFTCSEWNALTFRMDCEWPVINRLQWNIYDIIIIVIVIIVNALNYGMNIHRHICV